MLNTELPATWAIHYAAELYWKFIQTQ